METITRQSVLDLLDGDWAQYVARFHKLSPYSQEFYLNKQGYKRLADLLAHIVAWWEVGLQNIRAYQCDPAAAQPTVDVDSFNARAVQQARDVSDAGQIRLFEAARCKFVESVRALSEADFQDERVLNQLRWELVNHLDEHRIE